MLWNGYVAILVFSYLICQPLYSDFLILCFYIIYNKNVLVIIIILFFILAVLNSFSV